METTLVASPLAQAFSTELLEEAKLTRRVLERIPMAQFDWQPHVKSMTLGALTRHTADLLGWIKDTLDTTEIDVSVFDDAPIEPITSTEQLLAYFNQRVEAAHSGLQQATPEELQQQWIMHSGDYIIVSQSRAEVVRHLISHMIHHRGQLSVYLRLLDIPVPYIYGPSADETAAPE